MLKRHIRNTLFLFLLISLVHCGSGIEVAPGNSLPNNSPPNGTPTVSPITPQAPKFTQTTAGAFNIGSFFPADIDIVDQPGIRNIAFITTTTTPVVEAVDLNNNFEPSATVKGLSSLPSVSQGAGIPSNLFVVDATHAFLLTSTSIFYFNPTTEAVYQSVDLTQALTLSAPLKQADANGNALPDVSVGPFSPSFPASMVFAGNKLAVSFSNVFLSASSSRGSRGRTLVQCHSVFHISPSTPDYVVTSGFNLTSLTPFLTECSRYQYGLTRHSRF
jgi:hypothetical protein